MHSIRVIFNGVIKSLLFDKKSPSYETHFIRLHTPTCISIIFTSLTQFHCFDVWHQKRKNKKISKTLLTTWKCKVKDYCNKKKFWRCNKFFQLINKIHSQHKPPSSTTTTPPANTKTPSETSTASGKLSVSARRAQFQTSRRIMSAPIRPLNQLEDAKNKRKPRKKKVIRWGTVSIFIYLLLASSSAIFTFISWKDIFVLRLFIRFWLIFCAFFSSKLFCNNFRLNLTLNRDKELDESADEYADEVEDIKPLHSYPSQKSKKAPPMRSRSVLGCDQMGIETLVSMINSGESDSEKEDGQSAQQQQPPPPMIKNEPPQRIRANMLRKTGNAWNYATRVHACY